MSKAKTLATQGTIPLLIKPEIRTPATASDWISTPAAIPSIGDSHQGGYYFGQIWDEITTSSTSTTIGTGYKIFTVTNSAPLFYNGQAVKVVSRADAGTNYMVGTVAVSTGTVLVVNVTSSGGSGTYTDWSVVTKYRLIIAPKATGENASVQYKNANTSAPVECQTLTNGLAATAAMVAADTSTVYPMAWWAKGLNIGGYTDWYVPARDELELIWRNLKPTTDNNYTTANRQDSAIVYNKGGNTDDTTQEHGRNKHSEPAGSAYTSGIPAQTSVVAFRTGQSEAMEYGSSYYWSSSEYSSSGGWYQLFYTGYPGTQYLNNKTNSTRARAVRRSLV